MKMTKDGAMFIVKLAILYLVVFLLCAYCISNADAQDNTGFETVVYPLVFRDVEKINGDWLEKPITLSLDNVTDHMTRVSPAGDCIRYTIIAQLISSEFVHIDHVYCPVYYEDWHIDMLEFLTLDGQIFDF